MNAGSTNQSFDLHVDLDPEIQKPSLLLLLLPAASPACLFVVCYGWMKG